MNRKHVESVFTRLKDRKTPVCIVVHTNPDGDAIGSALGLYNHMLEQGFESVSVVAPNKYASFLHWMPLNEHVVIASDDKTRALEHITDARLIFCLDFNGFDRTAELSDVLNKSQGYKVMIDHHPEPEQGFDMIFSETQVSSTAELIFEWLAMWNGEESISPDSARCLYAGIVTDTGSFSYSCNHPRTYEIAGKLIEKGVDGNLINRLIYNTYSENRMRLLGYCLGEKLEVMHDGGAAFISLTRSELKRFDHQEGDTEGIVNYGLSIEGITLAALFTEQEDHIKISLRSAGDVDVNMLARSHFNGGGHQNAAGGKSHESMENTLSLFRTLVNKKLFR